MGKADPVISSEAKDLTLGDLKNWGRSELKSSEFSCSGMFTPPANGVIVRRASLAHMRSHAPSLRRHRPSGYAQRGE
jgi:hypothetical protein